MRFIRSHHVVLNQKGYTLIEILVVVSIIGILAGMVMVGGAAVINGARKAQATSHATNLRNAISAYYAEYRRLPMPATSSNTKGYIDFASDEAFMEILLGARSETAKKLNPKSIVFFSPKTAKRLAADRYINGVALSQDGTGAGSLWDPWGRLYGIRMDLSKREQMLNPAITKPNLSGKWAPVWGNSQKQELKYIAESIAVWSSGKEEASANDNIVSW